MRNSRTLRAERYSLHGPQSSIAIDTNERRISYFANFAAQLPSVIRERTASGGQKLPDSDEMSYFLSLSAELDQNQK